MTQSLRFGIIGCGTQGRFYAALLSGRALPGMPQLPRPAGCSLGALSSTDPQKAAALREAFGVPVYTCWQDMVLSGEVDAVVITLPHYLHHEAAIFCLEHGVHTLVEKPAGVRAKDVLAMNACAAAHPEAVFGILLNQRMNPLYQRLRQILASGELGELRRSVWIINSWWRPDSYYAQSPWRGTWGGEGGGVLVNQAPHQLDLWQWLCGVPKFITAKQRCGAWRDLQVENDVTILTEYENGATGVFVTCTHDPIGTDRLELQLSGGKIVVEDSKTATIYRLKQPEEQLNAAMTMEDMARLTYGGSTPLYEVETVSHTGGWGTQHAALFENFAAGVLTGSPLAAPGAEGHWGVELANAAHLSAWLGQTLALPVDPEVYAAKLNEKIREEGKFPLRD